MLGHRAHASTHKHRQAGRAHPRPLVGAGTRGAGTILGTIGTIGTGWATCWGVCVGSLVTKKRRSHNLPLPVVMPVEDIRQVYTYTAAAVSCILHVLHAAPRGLNLAVAAATAAATPGLFLAATTMGLGPTAHAMWRSAALLASVA